jgi:hypothetical protein
MTQGPPPPAQYPQFSTQGNSSQAGAALAVAALRRRVKAGANSFYFLAALSLINSIVSAVGLNLTFVFGLSISQIVDGMAAGLADNRPDLAIFAKVAALIVSIIISGIFAAFGFFGGQGRKWAFLVGMFLYFLDGVLLLVLLVWLGSGQVEDWIGLAVHLYFLWSLWRGLQVVNQLHKLVGVQTPTNRSSDFPKDIGVS